LKFNGSLTWKFPLIGVLLLRRRLSGAAAIVVTIKWTTVLAALTRAAHTKKLDHVTEVLCSPKAKIMPHRCTPLLRWLLIVAALSVGPAANAEPAHLACEGEFSADATVADQKHRMSLVIDLSARTVKVEGHPSVPIKGPVDEDAVAFASSKTADDVLDGTVNRITGELLIYFLTNPVYRFHGRCHRPHSLF
jgi:hypothetical protein